MASRPWVYVQTMTDESRSTVEALTPETHWWTPSVFALRYPNIASSEALLSAIAEDLADAGVGAEVSRVGEWRLVRTHGEDVFSRSAFSGMTPAPAVNAVRLEPALCLVFSNVSVVTDHVDVIEGVRPPRAVVVRRRTGDSLLAVSGELPRPPWATDASPDPR